MEHGFVCPVCRALLRQEDSEEKQLSLLGKDE